MAGAGRPSTTSVLRLQNRVERRLTAPPSHTTRHTAHLPRRFPTTFSANWRQDSLQSPSRMYSWLLARLGSGSAFACDAVARRVPPALRPSLQHRLAASSHRSLGSRLLLGCRIRSFAGFPQTTTTSADFSRSVRNRHRPPTPIVWRNREISQGKTLLLPSIAAGFTCVASAGHWAFPSVAGSPHHTGLVSGFCSSAPSFAAGFLSTPPRDDAVALG